MKSIVILASGSGTNAENIARFFSTDTLVRVKAVITDRENAPVRNKMENLGIPTVYFPRNEWREEPQRIADFIKENFEPDLVVLAGFNSILKTEFVKAYKGKILNIHPSLLPAYGGAGMWGHNVHEAVINAGEKESGVTVHIVTDEVDGGPIVMQQKVQVLDDDTPETLEARIHEAEYKIYPRAIIEMFRRADSELRNPEPDGETVPPPVQPDLLWAEALGIPHSPDDFKPRTTPPPVSGPQTPPLPEAGAQPPYASSPAQPPYHAATVPEDIPPMPPTYMVWAILSLICCCLPGGIVAVIMAAQVSSRYYQKDYEGAKRASRNAEIWIIISFVVGVLFNTLYLPFAILLGL